MRSRSLSRIARSWPRAAAAIAAGALAVGLAPVAWADGEITPSQADQGGMAEVTFSVPDDRGSAYTTEVQVQLPTDALVGEVYPLSVDDWAPKIEYRPIAKPIPGIHGSTSTVTSSVTWFRAVGKAPAAGAVSRLSLAMGGLPKADQLRFTVRQTYSDGSVRRWAGPVLKLVPAAGAAPSETASAAAGGGPAALPARVDLDEQGGSPISPAGHGLIAGALGCALIGAWWFSRRERSDRRVPAAEPAEL